METSTTPTAHEPPATGRGSNMRCSASQPMKTAEAKTRPAWTRAAMASPLPWPKRWSASAGAAAQRTAKKVVREAIRSSEESASDARIETDPEAPRAKAFIAINRTATATDRPVI